jgi:hypothetical protein
MQHETFQIVMKQTKIPTLFLLHPDTHYNVLIQSRCIVEIYIVYVLTSKSRKYLQADEIRHSMLIHPSGVPQFIPGLVGFVLLDI